MSKTILLSLWVERDVGGFSSAMRVRSTSGNDDTGRGTAVRMRIRQKIRWELMLRNGDDINMVG
jgi:hypothetical protein